VLCKLLLWDLADYKHVHISANPQSLQEQANMTNVYHTFKDMTETTYTCVCLSMSMSC